MHGHLAAHGCVVKDFAFKVDDMRRVYSRVVENGARGAMATVALSDSGGRCS